MLINFIKNKEVNAENTVIGLNMLYICMFKKEVLKSNKKSILITRSLNNKKGVLYLITNNSFSIKLLFNNSNKNTVLYKNVIYNYLYTNSCIKHSYLYLILVSNTITKYILTLNYNLMSSIYIIYKSIYNVFLLKNINIIKYIIKW